MNKVILSGWVCKNLKFYTTKTGKTKAEFDLAVKRAFKDKDGNYLYDFPHIICWVPGVVNYIRAYIKESSFIEILGSWHCEIVPCKDKTKKKKIDYVLVEKISCLSYTKADTSAAGADADFASMGEEVSGADADLDALDW